MFEIEILRDSIGYCRYYIKNDLKINAFKLKYKYIEESYADNLAFLFDCIYFLRTTDNKFYIGRINKEIDHIYIIDKLRSHKDENHWADALIFINMNTDRYKRWYKDDVEALESIFYNKLPTKIRLKNTNVIQYSGTKYQTEEAIITSYLENIFGYNIFDESLFNDTTIHFTEVITPDNIAEQMIDMLPSSVWVANTKFLDPACKSGIFLKKIYNKLMESQSLITEFPEEITRSNHILNNQLYGIALSNHAKVETITALDGFGKNIKKIPNYSNKIKGSGLGNNPDGSDRTFKDYINYTFGEENMKIDVVIGNPPYQENTGGGQVMELVLPYMINSLKMQRNYLDIHAWWYH